MRSIRRGEGTVSSVPSASAVSSVDAAALQAEMAKKYGIIQPTLARPRPPRNRDSGRSRDVSKGVPKELSLTCPSCAFETSYLKEEGKPETCSHCGVFFPVVTQTTSSLAQRRGLISYDQSLSAISQSIEKSALKPLEWYVLEGHLQRKIDPDCWCPICMEKFTTGEEILLSCGHIFHAPCLRSFENFMKTVDLACPMCRTKNYQKKITNLGTVGYERYSAKRIQAIIRGFIARRQYKQKLRRYYRSGQGNEGRRKRFFEKEFTNMSKKMDDSLGDRTQKVDSLLQSMDRTLLESRQLDLLFEQLLAARSTAQPGAPGVPSTTDTVSTQSPPRPPPVAGSGLLKEGLLVFDEWEYCPEASTPWKMVRDQCLARGAGDCAICMIPLPSPSANVPTSTNLAPGRKSVLLSCTHMFHEMCIMSFERFSRSESPTCPVCRSTYSKRLLQH